VVVDVAVDGDGDDDLDGGGDLNRVGTVDG